MRRALKLIAPAPKAGQTEEQQAAQQAQLKLAEAWMEKSLLDSVTPALTTDWILDCDPTVKALYGHQSGAEIGYPGFDSSRLKTPLFSLTPQCLSGF